MSTSIERCSDCGEEMKFLDGEWVCEFCDSVSGFVMTPSEDRDSFEL